MASEIKKIIELLALALTDNLSAITNDHMSQFSGSLYMHERWERFVFVLA